MKFFCTKPTKMCMRINVTDESHHSDRSHHILPDCFSKIKKRSVVGGWRSMSLSMNSGWKLVHHHSKGSLTLSIPVAMGSQQKKKKKIVWIQTLYDWPLYITQGKSCCFNRLGLSHLEDKGIGYLVQYLKFLPALKLWNFLTSFSLINSWVPQVNLVKYYNCSENSSK